MHVLRFGVLHDSRTGLGCSNPCLVQSVKGGLDQKEVAYHAGNDTATGEPHTERLFIPDTVLNEHDCGFGLVDSGRKQQHHLVLLDSFIGAYDVVK